MSIAYGFAGYSPLKNTYFSSTSLGVSDVFSVLDVASAVEKQATHKKKAKIYFCLFIYLFFFFFSPKFGFGSFNDLIREIAVFEASEYMSRFNNLKIYFSFIPQRTD